MNSRIISVLAFASVMVCSSCRSIPFETQILSYEGNKVDRTYVFDGAALSEDGAGRWNVDIEKKKISSEAVDCK